MEVRPADCWTSGDSSAAKTAASSAARRWWRTETFVQEKRSVDSTGTTNPHSHRAVRDLAPPRRGCWRIRWCSRAPVAASWARIPCTERRSPRSSTSASPRPGFLCTSGLPTTRAGSSCGSGPRPRGWTPARPPARKWNSNCGSKGETRLKRKKKSLPRVKEWSLHEMC